MIKSFLKQLCLETIQNMERTKFGTLYVSITVFIGAQPLFICVWRYHLEFDDHANDFNLKNSFVIFSTLPIFYGSEYHCQWIWYETAMRKFKKSFQKFFDKLCTDFSVHSLLIKFLCYLDSIIDDIDVFLKLFYKVFLIQFSLFLSNIFEDLFQAQLDKDRSSPICYSTFG